MNNHSIIPIVAPLICFFVCAGCGEKPKVISPDAQEEYIIYSQVLGKFRNLKSRPAIYEWTRGVSRDGDEKYLLKYSNEAGEDTIKDMITNSRTQYKLDKRGFLEQEDLILSSVYSIYDPKNGKDKALPRSIEDRVIFSFSRPGFNSERNKACVVAYLAGGPAISVNLYVFKKISDAWKFDGEFTLRTSH